MLSLRSPASFTAVMFSPVPLRNFASSCAVLLCLLGASLAPAQESEDPSEVFLKAFTSVQQGEKFEKDGSYKFALSKYRFAASLIEQIQQRNPNWQPLIVQYRMRKTAEAIARSEQRLTLDKTPAGATEPPAPAPTAAPRQPMPPSRDGVDPLPTNEVEIPGVRRAVAVSTPLPLNETATRATRDARVKKVHAAIDWRSSARSEIASEMSAVVRRSRPPRSATVRATRSTR